MNNIINTFISERQSGIAFLEEINNNISEFIDPYIGTFGNIHGSFILNDKTSKYITNIELYHHINKSTASFVIEDKLIKLVSSSYINILKDVGYGYVDIYDFISDFDKYKIDKKFRYKAIKYLNNFKNYQLRNVQDNIRKFLTLQ